MRNHYIATVNVIIDGNDSLVVPVAGWGFEINGVKKAAEEKVREQHPGKKITSVLLNKRELDMHEYLEAIGSHSQWLVIAE